MKKEPEEYKQESEEYDKFHWEILTHTKDWIQHCGI
jgi:hypothetical protein